LPSDDQKITGQTARVQTGFRPLPPEYHQISTRKVFAEFWSYARAQMNVFAIILLSVLLQGGVAGGTIFLLKRALDLFFESNTVSTMLALIGTLFLATVCKSVLEFVFGWKKSVAVARIHDRVLVDAFRDLLYNPLRYHVIERDRSKYSWVLKDSIKFVEAFFGMFNAWGKQPFVLLSTITALWIISPQLTMVGVALVPLGIPCVVYLKRKIKRFVEQRQALLGVTEEMVSETIVFNNSLYDEIKIACPNASREAVESAARASGLTDYLSTIGRDLDTWIGDRGIQFSGGQRQMIAIEDKDTFFRGAADRHWIQS
jgi:ABC-type multidrug transport system fused ATPase/permease subunit